MWKMCNTATARVEHHRAAHRRAKWEKKVECPLHASSIIHMEFFVCIYEKVPTRLLRKWFIELYCVCRTSIFFLCEHCFIFFWRDAKDEKRWIITKMCIHQSNFCKLIFFCCQKKKKEKEVWPEKNFNEKKKKKLTKPPSSNPLRISWTKTRINSWIYVDSSTKWAKDETSCRS